MNRTTIQTEHHLSSYVKVTARHFWTEKFLRNPLEKYIDFIAPIVQKVSQKLTK